MSGNMSRYQEIYVKELKTACLSHMYAGLSLYHENNDRSRNCLTDEILPPLNHAIISNLTLAVEQMLKAYLAGKNLSLVIRPTERNDYRLTAYLSVPETLPLNPLYERIFRSQSFHTAGIRECIELFVLFHPEAKKQHDLFMDGLSDVRNCSVHGYVPYHKLYVQRPLAYTILKLNDFLKTQGFDIGYCPMYIMGDKDEKVIELYDQLIKYVHKKITDAEANKSKQPQQNTRRVAWDPFVNVDPEYLSNREDPDWDSKTHECFVCGQEAELKGYTEFSAYPTEQDSYDLELSFVATAFHCSHCKLSLTDEQELSIANVAPTYSRSSEELDLWLQEDQVAIEHAMRERANGYTSRSSGCMRR